MKWLGIIEVARNDERDTFVVIATGQTCVWRAADKGCIWHATVDGLAPVCRSRIVLGDNDPYPSTVDRADDMMTCMRCAELVRRVRADGPRKVDARAVDEAKRRDEALRLGVEPHELGRRQLRRLL